MAKSLKVCGISDNLDGSENALIHCAKELPALAMPYATVTRTSSFQILTADSTEDEED